VNVIHLVDPDKKKNEFNNLKDAYFFFFFYRV